MNFAYKLGKAIVKLAAADDEKKKRKGTSKGKHKEHGRDSATRASVSVTRTGNILGNHAPGGGGGGSVSVTMANSSSRLPGGLAIGT